MRTNALSAVGRSGWTLNMMLYPALFLGYQFVYKPDQARKEEQARLDGLKNCAQARPVDPDYFNPFTPIPFHNNPELKYAHAHINMRNYLNKNHINPQDYMYKSYLNAYDHDNKKIYTYNWTSVGV